MLRSLLSPVQAAKTRRSSADQQRSDALVQMVMSTQAVIHFSPDATILFANDNFLGAMGFADLSEIAGRKHAIFVEPDFAQSTDYQDFWDELRRGNARTDVFKRLRKDGTEIWIDATYAPVFGPDGQVERVIKVARDVTDKQLMIQLLFDGLENLRAGDLTLAEFDQRYEEVRNLGLSFNDMVSTMADFVNSVRSTTTKAHGIASQLGSETEDLARRGESQAASLEQVAAAITQLSASAESSVARAQESHNLAQSSQEKAESGRKVVGSVKGAMTEIESSSV